MTTHNTTGTGSRVAWDQNFNSYKQLLNSDTSDSKYLRDHGLKPMTLRMATKACLDRVLDLGCGTGWLFDELNPVQGHESDLSDHRNGVRRWQYSNQDILSTNFSENEFTLVVASMVLMWIDDLDRASKELYRITDADGQLVISLPHPFLYRNGNVNCDGTFLLDKKYAETRRIDDLYIGGASGPYTYYHRPIHQYINALSKAGWAVSEMDEWSLDRDHYVSHFNCDHQNSAFMHRTELAPLFLAMRCVKK